MGVVIVSALVYLAVLRPLVNVSLVSIILATMALSILFENFALVRWGGYGKSVPAFTGNNAIFVGSMALPQSLWVIGLMIAVLIGLYILTSRTRVGKMTATANDPAAASLCGVNTGRMILLAFAISAAIGAFLGGIAVSPINSINYLSGGIYGLGGPVAAILGGWGSSTGAVVGGLALGIVASLVTGCSRPVIRMRGGSRNPHIGPLLSWLRRSIGRPLCRRRGLMKTPEAKRRPAPSPSWRPEGDDSRCVVACDLDRAAAHLSEWLRDADHDDGWLVHHTHSGRGRGAGPGRATLVRSLSLLRIGAYTAALLSMRVSVPTLPALVIGAFGARTIALIIGRPVLKLRHFYLALATIGLGRSS